MKLLIEKISDLNDLLMQGATEEAFEKFYHDEIVTQVNDDSPVIGKSANRKIREVQMNDIVEFNNVEMNNDDDPVEYEVPRVYNSWGIAFHETRSFSFTVLDQIRTHHQSQHPWMIVLEQTISRANATAYNYRKEHPCPVYGIHPDNEQMVSDDRWGACNDLNATTLKINQLLRYKFNNDRADSLNRLESELTENLIKFESYARNLVTQIHFDSFQAAWVKKISAKNKKIKARTPHVKGGPRTCGVCCETGHNSRSCKKIRKIRISEL